MRLTSLCLAGLSVCLIVACSGTKNNENQEIMIEPPVARKQPYELTLHGDTRIDNYYWMRLSDAQKTASVPDAQTEEVLRYLEAENTYADTMLQSTDSLQSRLYDEMVGRISQKDESVPYLRNGYFYYSRYEEGKEYPIYCRKKGNLEATEEVLIDANQRGAAYEFYHVAGLSVSPDNKILAFAEDTLSRRIYSIRFKNLETGEFYEDEIPFAQAEVAWASDNKTLFYTSKNKVSLLSEEIKRHRLGTEVERDVVVYKEDDPSYYIGCYRSKSGEFIIIYNSSTLSSDYHILKSDNPEGAFHQFTPREEVHEYSIEHFGDKFYVLTNWDATNFRLMEVGENATDKSEWKEVIPHREDVLLSRMEVFRSFLALEERKSGLNNIRILNQNTKEDYYIPMDEEAYATGISVNEEFDTEIIRYNYSSLATPNTVYDFDMATKERKLMKREEVVGGHDPSQYQIERVMVKARDGKMVPMSIVYKKGFKKDGQAPVLLYGYGSYGYTIDPGFSSSRLSLLDRGFAFAIAHIRGSQTMGRQWYEDGKMFHKKNTFTDFIDCGQYLVDQQYTSREKLFAMGGSAGGLLMGAVANMAPNLFKGIIAAVPFVDVLTTMADPTIPLTTNEYDEWGNPANQDEYAYMKSYSPYDNVTAQDYPNMLVMTGYFDSQVQYWEPAKWVAKLRDYKTDEHLLLLHTNMDAGHGGASGRFEAYKEVALEYAFMLYLAGMEQ